ncbi:hypothetical protein BKA81DRAFT_173411 [Phyllosticta paracitricarpa]
MTASGARFLGACARGLDAMYRNAMQRNAAQRMDTCMCCWVRAYPRQQTVVLRVKMERASKAERKTSTSTRLRRWRVAQVGRYVVCKLNTIARGKVSEIESVSTHHHISPTTKLDPPSKCPPPILSSASIPALSLLRSFAIQHSRLTSPTQYRPDAQSHS